MTYKEARNKSYFGRWRGQDANRIIKESICASDTIDQLTYFEEVFFYRLIVNCDDYGRFDARLPILKARLFPLKSVTEKKFLTLYISYRR